MALVGLSIIIALLSFFCYRHLSSSWALLDCFRPGGLLRNHNKETITHSSNLEETKGGDSQKHEYKKDLDRQAMPPPPPPQSRVLSVAGPFTPHDTLKAQPTNTSSPARNSTLESTTTNPISQFPALNSIQRASGTRAQPQCDCTPSLQPPLRSTSLASPPVRLPLPDRSPTACSPLYLSLPPTHNAIPAKPSRKVLLSPGHSPLDWAYLTSRPDVNLTGLPPATPFLRVTPSLLRLHTGRKGKDAWTVLGGKVYNISPYLPYHPGGEPELMKAAGRDGTKLFGEVHPWVNWEGMLEPCLVGIAVAENEVYRHNPLEDID